MRALHTVDSTLESYGGTSRSVPALCEALAAAGVQTTLLTTVPTGRGAEPSILPERPARSVVVERRGGVLGRVRTAWTFRGELRRWVENEDAAIVHDHGAWLSTNRVAARAARRAGVALVISPRGMLTRWSLGFRAHRKRAAWILFQRRMLETARVLHATSEAEADDLRRLGLSRPIAVVPNGVRVPPEARSRDDADGARRVLFLSRLHPKKGLPNLIEAWSRVRRPGWVLELVGPDEGGYRSQIEGLVAERGLGGSVRLSGVVRDDEKWAVYRTADVFVLPSFSENFGSVVAEALACGVPAIATRTTPWSELETHGCGWWVDVGAEPLADALESALGASDEVRAEMGRRGRALVESRYAWPAVAERLRDVYAWITGNADRPECVRGGE